MPKIPQEFIDEVIAKSSLVDFIGKYLPLKQFGPNFKAVCPFHNEKTPSLSISSAKQVYHCFGCGASGNIITFIMEYKNLDFIAAIELLAGELNMDIPAASPEQEARHNITKQAQHVYAKIMDLYRKDFNSSKEANDYVLQRKISKVNIDKFMIGYSADSWDNLSNKFSSSIKILLDTGMVLKNNNKIYDRFRGRLMFPIINERGICVGFGARTLTDQMPKYLNSSDSFLFKKGNELYGLYQVINSKKNISNIIVVEGYMDVIALADFNINNVVASLGTAITRNQIQKILKFTNKITFCFDGDKAGNAAAWKALLNIMPLMHTGIFVKFVFLPEGEDPDSYINKVGKVAFANYFKSAEDLTDYMFRYLQNLHKGDNITAKTNFINACNDIIKTLPMSIFRSLLEDRLNKLAGINISQPKPKIKPKIKKTININMTNNLYRLFALITQNPKVFISVQTSLCDIKAIIASDIVVSKIYNYLSSTNKTINTAVLLENFREDESFQTIEKLVNSELFLQDINVNDECCVLIENIKKDNLQETINKLLTKSKIDKLTIPERELLQQLLKEQKV